MTTEKRRGSSLPAPKGTRVFKEVATLNANEVGITLRVDEEVLKKFDEIQEETTKAAQESQKFAWR